MKIILLQIDPLLKEASRYGLLGLLVLAFGYVIYYLFKANEEKAKALVENALLLAKQDHEENKTLIKDLENKTAENLKTVELERKVEREKFYEIINKFQTVVQDNTEVMKQNTEILKQIVPKLNQDNK